MFILVVIILKKEKQRLQETKKECQLMNDMYEMGEKI